MTKEKRSLYNDIIGEVNFLPSDVAEHTVVPSNPHEVPRVIGWSGPARVGTTALLFLLANHPLVDKVYFQPQKTLLRAGKPDFILSEKDKLVCMKEVYGQMSFEEFYDPIEMLLKAGVPSNKITWVMMLREPVQAFASWSVYFPSVKPEVFATAQLYTISQYHNYKDKGVHVIPFVYDILEDQEECVIQRMLSLMGLGKRNLDLRFNRAAIADKLVPGQAADQDYFNFNLKPTQDKAEFVYSRNSYFVPPAVVRRVHSLCDPSYNKYLRLVEREFRLPKLENKRKR